MKLHPSPVKTVAEAAGIRVLQPPTLRTEEAQSDLRALGADVFAVVAYGLILPQTVLDIPPLGCINVHFSLLPAFRGAAPVQWAVAEGHRESGVAIMQMQAGLDTGPVLKMLTEPILPDDTSGTLAERLSALGALELVEVIEHLEDLEAVPQPEEGSSYASKITPHDAHIDWSQPAETIANRIRAFNPRPGAWGTLNGKRLKIWKASVGEATSGQESGTLIVGPGGTLEVQTGSTLLRLEIIQPEGKSAMDTPTFVRGNRPERGARLT